MAEKVRSRLSTINLPASSNADTLWAALANHPDGQQVFTQLDQFLAEYGYLSEVATDIAVPTWQESPQPVRELFAQYLSQPEASESQVEATSQPKPRATGWRSHQVQARLNLKGQVAEVYNRLLAELRGCFVALEKRWLAAGNLQFPGDIFFLTWDEIRRQITDPLPVTVISAKIGAAKAYWQRQHEQRVPYLVYGQTTVDSTPAESAIAPAAGILKGIGASTGQVEGTVCVLNRLPDSLPEINGQTILVVPYTDAGWSPLLARIGGLISEVGGQLSHGAIIAREYGIPAVMEVADATCRLSTGQRVRIDGRHGTIEIL
jgi:pyruvate,water dikinase